MKDWMSWHHHGAIHVPHPVHWLHQKRLGLPLLLAGLIILLVIGLQILAGRSGMINRMPETYPALYPQEVLFP